jgi:hypothetical protein
VYQYCTKFLLLFFGRRWLKTKIARPKGGNDEKGKKQERGQAAAQKLKRSPYPPRHETYTRSPMVAI